MTRPKPTTSGRSFLAAFEQATCAAHLFGREFMSIFNRLFKSNPQPPVRDVAALTAPYAVPAVHVRQSDVVSRSHAGGQPNLPGDTKWPSRNGVPLDFLARISLAEVQDAVRIDWLPPSGALLFFYDLERQTWGFDPADRGSWAVLHVEDLDDDQIASLHQSSDSGRIPFRSFRFVPFQSLPSWERESIKALDLSDAESDALFKIADSAFGGRPAHQIGGFPTPVQGDDMELEAQLVSNGLYCGDATGYNDPRAAELRPGAADWRLLFQFDSDDDLGVMWGDLGILYFWVTEARAKQGDFREAWLVQQCH